MITLDIVATGDYYAPVSDQQPPADLRAEVQAVCRQYPRRIDRFIQLALLGACRCSSATALLPGQGLYLGSRFAALGNTVRLQQELIAENLIPKPAQFINTLSNSAGYYVAKELGLSGINSFVSRMDASLHAALQLAFLDIQQGNITAALIGQVEEGILPTSDHCFRLGVASDTPLAEGSHWLQLQASTASTVTPLARLQMPQTLANREQLQAWLQQQPADSRAYLVDSTTASEVTALQSAHRRFSLDLNYYPGQAAAALIRYIHSDLSEPLLLVVADNAGRYHVLSCTRP